MVLFLGRLFGLIIGLITILQTWQDFKKRRITLLPAIFWLVVWTVIIIFSVSPTLLDFLIQKTGGKTGFGTILGIGLVTSLFLMYKIYLRTEILNSRINTLIIELKKLNG